MSGDSSAAWIDAAEIACRVDRFKLETASSDPRVIARRFVETGPCFLLDESHAFELRNAIADRFAVNPNEVLVVGSAKLGFSIAPYKRFRPFCDESDIDIAIVSPNLFANVWRSVYEFWWDGGYWERFDDFVKYLFQGWVRPDKLPPANRFDYCRKWWEFFRELTAGGRFGPFAIRAGLYKSWAFLESYYCRSIRDCKKELEEQT